MQIIFGIHPVLECLKAKADPSNGSSLFRELPTVVFRKSSIWHDNAVCRSASNPRLDWTANPEVELTRECWRFANRARRWIWKISSTV